MNLPSTLTLTLANRIDAMERGMDEAEAFLETHEASPKLAFAVRLAMEELISNIIKYAYDDEADHTIEVRLELTNPATLTLIDDGRAFDPLADAPAPVLDGPVEDRPIGGLGLHMLRSMGHQLAYRRQDEKNILLVTLASNIES